MHVIDLEGEKYPLQATTTNEGVLNGNQAITFTIKSNKVNDLFIDDIERMWEITDQDNVTHKIIYVKKQGAGERLTAEVKGIPLFFDKLDTTRTYETYNKSMPAAEFFNLVFNGTGFNYVLVDSFYAIEWEGVGDGETNISMFKRGLERYKAEFRISGNTVYLQSKIGRDTSFMYRHRLNASNIVQEDDASAFWTYIKGFADFEEGEEENAAITAEYPSPLSNIPGIGLRHAPPFYDGRIKDINVLKERLKKIVEESLKISVSATIHDLRKQGYALAQPELGDRVFLIDERIGLKAEVRIYDMSITRDWKGNVLNLNLTFGSPSLMKRKQSEISDGIKRIDDIVNGREQLPYNVLPPAVKRASEALLSAMTELEFVNGIIARDPSDPNRLVLYNSAGLGISLDGGMTFEEAITYLGINTKLLTAGDIHTNHIRIIGEDNYFFWDGNALEAINPNDIRKYVKLTSDGLYIARGALTIERPDGAKFISDGIPNLNYNVQGSSPPFTSALVRVTNQWYITESTSDQNVDMFSFRHEGRYLKVTVAHRMETEGTSSGAVTVRGLADWSNVINSYTVFSNSVEDGSEYHTFTIDIGIPTYQSVNFYVQLRTGAANRRAMTRVLRCWQEG